ncbi:hypothetical protein ACFLVH_04215 [Chloroflexota bacterium]
MFPSELIILMAIQVSRDSGRKLLALPTDGSTEYISTLYEALVRRGYMKGSISGGYRLSSKGMAGLFEFLSENETRIIDTIRTLQRLGIEFDREIDQLVKGAS